MAIKVSELELANETVKKLLGDALKAVSFLSDLQRQMQTEINRRVNSAQPLTPGEQKAEEDVAIHFQPRLPIGAVDNLNMTADERNVLQLIIDSF